ncbi:hypothetical protein HNR46_004317 [Haloferula luteola]|uniref:Uncharacterized protein n=1 Tax=Haloferula luteola TaxID=595692 RepID=A0A840V7P9_9BACT|nr:hypothetical protein [Haloferula luteola]
MMWFAYDGFELWLFSLEPGGDVMSRMGRNVLVGDITRRRAGPVSVLSAGLSKGCGIILLSGARHVFGHRHGGNQIPAPPY